MSLKKGEHLSPLAERRSFIHHSLRPDPNLRIPPNPVRTITSRVSSKEGSVKAWVVKTLALGLVSVGCGGGSHRTAEIPVYSIASGFGTPIKPGVQAGYGITSGGGGSYRIVWTGDAAASGSYHVFRGVVTTAGNMSDPVRGCADGSCPLESGDSVSNATPIRDGTQISFDTTATDGLDGFDFSVDTEPVYFDIYIDDVHFPNLVNFPNAALGGDSSTVSAIPFELRED